MLPVRNGMPFLPLAVDSILEQTFQDFELLVIDDGSSDETPAYLKSVDDPRLVYIRINRSPDIVSGLTLVLNEGLKRARGDLVARMDADDIANNDRFKEQIAMFEIFPRLVAASVQFDRIDESGQVIDRNHDFTADSALRFYMLFSPCMLHPGLMFKREQALLAGGYTAEFDVAEDYEFYTRIAKYGTFANSDKVLMRYRTSKNSVSSRKAERQLRQSSIIASRYASSIIDGITFDQWQSVRQVCVGAFPVQSHVPNISRWFRIASKSFEAHFPEDRELRVCVRLWMERLRSRCFALAKANFASPYRCAFWLFNANNLGFKIPNPLKALRISS